MDNDIRPNQFEHQFKLQSRHCGRGFTLLELMLTVGILALVAGFAAPSFVSTLRANRIVTDNNAVISALTLARSEAIKRGSRVTVCRSADQATCAGSGGWEQGWIVFADPASAGNVNTGEEIIRVWDPLDGGTTVRPGTSFVDFVSFVGSGETRAAPNNSDVFNVCGEDAVVANGRTITVGMMGYARTEYGATACP